MMVTLARRALFSVARALERVRNGALYAAVGTMRLHELRAAIAESWGSFNEADADIHSGLMAWEQAFADRFITPGGRVLLVGSGTGRDLLALVRMRTHVVGIEPSARAAARARQALAAQGMSADVIEGYFEDTDVPGLFDTIVFSYFCYSYIPGRARRVEVLDKARRHLSPGGRIIVSFLFRQNPPHGRVITIGRLAGALSRSDWRMETGDAIERGGIVAPAVNYEHMFGPGEIEAEAAAAGLSVEGRGGHPHYEPWIVLTSSSNARATS